MTDETEEIKFQLLSSHIFDWGFPPPNQKFSITEDDVHWKYKFKFHVSKFPIDARCIVIDLACKLHYRNPKKKTSIARSEIHNSFKIEGATTDEGKLLILYTALEISSWNLQGVFAAGLGDTPISSFICPSINFKQYEEDFKQKLRDEWD
jgi:hypothetical protein